MRPHRSPDRGARPGVPAAFPPWRAWPAAGRPPAVLPAAAMLRAPQPGPGQSPEPPI